MIDHHKDKDEKYARRIVDIIDLGILKKIIIKEGSGWGFECFLCSIQSTHVTKY